MFESFPLLVDKLFNGDDWMLAVLHNHESSLGDGLS